MRIETLESISINELNKGFLERGKNTMICCSAYSESNDHIHINPILILKNNTFFKINDFPKTIMYGPKFKESNDEKFELLHDRFLENELFKVIVIHPNQREIVEMPFFTYGNNTAKLEHEVHEIYDGEFDLDDDFFIPDQIKIWNLLKNKDEAGQSSYFYIKTANHIFGPFNLNGIDGNKVKLKAIHNADGYIYSWPNTACQDLFVEFETDEKNGSVIKRKIVANWLPDNIGKKIKFLSNDELVNFIVKNTNNLKQFSKNELNIFKRIHAVFSNSQFLDVDESIYRRAQRLFDQSKLNKELFEKFLSYMPETELVKEEITNLEINKTNLKDEISALTIKKQDIKNKIDELYAEQNEIESKLSQGKKLQEIRETEEIEEAIKDNEKLKKLLNEKMDLDEELNKISKYENIKEIEKEISEKEIEIKVLEKKENELKVNMTYLRQEFISTQKEANEKLKDLIKAKTHFDFISGREFGNSFDFNEELKIEKDTSSYLDKSLTAPDGTNFVSHERMLLEELNQKLKDAGRTFSRSFIANLLISIHQNTFTIFAGMPGSGKTSLARLLSHILVKNPIKKVEISVAKGWTSQKDFIGFYNPLSKSFCSTDSRIYQLLKLMDIETREQSFFDSPLGYVILDEANLSPIEHYWSSFYNLTDSNADNNNFLSINLGTDQNMFFANNLRFIGTINSDQTTEELSPRIIDRVNIIRIPKTFDLVPFVNSNSNVNAINEFGLTFKDAIKLFNLKDFNDDYQKNWEMFSQKETYKDILDKYEKLKMKFEILNLNISPRIDIAFANYCMIALNFMNAYRALDYFIAQRILTKIEGHGELYRKHLIELKEEMQGILTDKRIEGSESCDILQKIIEVDSNGGLYDDYNYFLIS